MEDPTDPPVEDPTDPPVTAPPPSITWDNPIKGYFLPSDVACMIDAGGFDLSNKDDVTAHADGIYTMVKNKLMPQQMAPFTQENPDPNHPLWTDEMVDNFKAWQNAGFP